MERRYTKAAAATIETREDGGKTLVGLGAVFYTPGVEGTEYRLGRGMVERIAPEAFDRALSDGDDARGLFNHDSNHILGRVSSGTMRLSKVAEGLRYEIDLPDTQAGRDVAESVDRGDLTGSSFAFRVESVDWTEEQEVNVRTIRSVELFDTGPVTYPAYLSTTTGIRAESEADEAWEGLQNHKRRQREHRAKSMQMRARIAELDAAGHLR